MFYVDYGSRQGDISDSKYRRDEQPPPRGKSMHPNQK